MTQRERIGAKRQVWLADLEDFEACLTAAVPALGVAQAAMDQLRERFVGREVYIGHRDGNGFLISTAVTVASCCVERGFPAPEALEMGRIASEAVLMRYKGSKLYFAKQVKYALRDLWIQTAYSTKSAAAIMKATGLTHQRLQQIIRAARVRPMAKAG